MSMRITTGMIAGQYSKNLNQSRNDLSRAQRQSYTYRAFDRVSDDPFAAAQTFQVRRDTELNEDYQSNLSNVQSAVTTAESTLQNVFNVLSNANSSGVLKSINGTMSSDNRSQIATQLVNMSKTILADMNQEYADGYLFAGAGSSGAPFSTDASGNLLYRGINVDTGENTNGASATLQYAYGGSPKTMQINFGKDMGKQLEGYSMNINVGGAESTSVNTSAKTMTVTVPSGTTKKQLQTYLQGTSFSNSLKRAFGITPTDMSGITVGGTAADAVSTALVPATSISESSALSTELSDPSYSITLSGTPGGSLSESIDTVHHTITVGYNEGVTTNQQLQDYLRNCHDIPDAIPSVNVNDLAGFTVSGNPNNIVSNVPSPATSISFGSLSSGALSGYTVVMDGTGTGVSASVDTSAKTITLKYQNGTTTNQQLQNYLQSSDFEDTLNNSVESFSWKNSGITIDNVSEVGGDAVQSSTGGGSISSFVSLSDLANEKVYVDIGLGLKTDANGNIIDQTAYNSALPGISFLGYGKDPTTSASSNAYNLLTKMANILKNSSSTGDALISEMTPYMDSFTNTISHFATQQADVGSKMTFLTTTSSYLTDANTNLQAKDEQVEFVDPADAIMNYYMQRYSYQAALQTGNSILQPTLLDFMK